MVIGIICIVAAFISCFILAPLINRSVEAKTEVVRFTKELKAGTQITSNMIETVTVGSYNLPSNVLKENDEIIGQYVVSKISKGDFVFEDKLSKIPITNNEYLLELDGKKQALSITIPSFAGGLSGKLESGDIISVIAVDYGELRETIIPNELKYVRILAVTTNEGQDTKATIKGGEEEEAELPSTVTLLVDEVQAKLLAKLENNSSLHLSLIYRGTKEQADQFLQVQDTYILENYVEKIKDKEGEKEIIEDAEEGVRNE